MARCRRLRDTRAYFRVCRLAGRFLTPHGGYVARLWLLTDHYPFGAGETFIAAELTYLLAQGIHIHIVPTARGALEQTAAPRCVPHGVVIRRDIALGLAQARAAARLHHVGLLARVMCRPELRAGGVVAWMRRAVKWRPRTAGHCLRRWLQALAHAGMLAEVIASLDDAPARGDGIYAYWLNASILGMRWACPQARIVARAHGHDLFAERHLGHYLPLQQLIVAQLAALYCISDAAYRYACAVFCDARHVICMMPLGVEATSYRARPSTDNLLRIISCARVSPVKDLDLWIAALAQVQTPVLWTHLGDGADKPRLMQACKHLPKHVRVRWAGAIAHHAVLETLCAEPVDLFVNTSRNEGRPVSIMEALSVGLVVRATDVGASGEMLPEAWLWHRRDGASGIAQHIDAYAAMPRAHRLAAAEMALQCWQTHAHAAVHYPAFARHLMQATELLPPAL